MSDQERNPTLTDPVDGKWMRDAWRALAAEDAAGTSQVDDEAIWRAVAGEGSAEERHAVIDVVARDPAAAESWRLAQELQRELAEREPSLANSQLGDQPVVTALWRRRPLQWASIAALLFLIPGLGLWRLLEPPGVESPDSGTGEQEYRDAPTAQLLNQVSEDVPQPRDKVILSWSDEGLGTPDSGTRYILSVSRSDFEPLVVLRELTSTSVRLSAQALSGVAVGERLQWQVEARRADGQVVKSSTFFLFLAPATGSSTLSDQP